ncbi:hypothetical protein FRACYDRAFT_263729 [Fragilariopsis cylindrus CCMP1102]|uniref:BTB domain-containing protein n=1 Tax=Fragilariopsis cylindrus CCMP1102 TaxID=635003 RepID=A0A1E7EXW1_9STRA|nr:hypothetical protein FRACYDRAFT_263729 [Fragilariopsis cylindrus CCMP1102]|eukprot:OEU10860.1 hypothetical protein FRACYDRAFT_263729 [Fragilariopsis cylindrus CCMP1102]
MEDDDNHAKKRKQDNDHDDDHDDDDPSVLWERCQQSHKKRVKKMKEEKDNLQNEIETMNNSIVGSTSAAAAATSNEDVIIEINAGGKIISALRSTLTLAPNTMFTYMFSGRWEESMKRDDNNRVYLDHDPDLIEIIVNFLRMKKIEDPTKPVQSPMVRIEKRNNFDYLLRYFGLADFFYPSPVFLPLDTSKIDVVQHGSSVTVTKSDNKIKFRKVTGGKKFTFVACKPSLNATSDEGSFWKVTIDVLAGNSWLLLGIIGHLGASYNSHVDPTSYGWSNASQVLHGGFNRNGDSGWTTFTQGECLHFHLKSNKLTMFSVQKSKKFVIDIDTTVPAYYIHFNIFNAGTMLTLEPLGEDEQTRMLEN